MNWKEPQLKFPCSQLSCALVEFCDEVLVETKRAALGLLEELRSCRVTLNQLRRVDAVEFVPSVEGGETKDIVRSTLDDPSAGEGWVWGVGIGFRGQSEGFALG